MSYAMVIDLKKCVGCNGCHTACKESNGTPPGVFRAWVNTVDEGKYPDTRRTFEPRLCMHCENPPCVEVCPVNATYKDENGIIVVDKEVCIGDQNCISACPYTARYYRSSEEGYFDAGLSDYEAVAYTKMPVSTVDKCDFCKSNGRFDAGEKPACVKACHAEARTFGKYDDLKSMIDDGDAYQLLPEQGTSPSVWYLPNKYY